MPALAGVGQRVAEQVEEHLFQAHPVAAQAQVAQDGRQFEAELEALVGDLVGHRRLQAVADAAEIEGLRRQTQLVAFHAGDVEHVA